MLEKDLNIYDIWQAPSGNLFIKISDEYSIAIGERDNHDPTNWQDELNQTQYAKRDDITPVKKVGRLVFD